MRIYNNFDLTEFNSYRIKAICKTAFFPESEEDLIDLFTNNESFILIGSGHNIILSKKYYDESFIIFNGNYNRIELDTNKYQVSAQAGVSMLELSTFALENELSGLEIFYDIPSSLGGAVVMNAGASGEEIKDILVKVRYFDLHDKTIHTIDIKDLDFEYRNSFFQKNKDKIILAAWMQLDKKDKNIISDKMNLIKNNRWSKQPKEFPNAGSVFKRPEGKFVGPMIETLGLKGFTVGGAQVSEKHAGFIINYNGATGEDILDLIKHIKDKVKEAYFVDLEVEQRII